ncbi:hypothetical protein HG530_005995 [Fusarium avenaceum]|nr:hypothetical protein HG530_005995 [Fusarium avenaceum]
MEVLLTQNADLLTRQALLLGILSRSGNVSVASRCRGLDRLLESPGNLLKSPEVNGLGLLVAAHETIESQVDSVATCGVDNVVVVGAGLDVGGREDADRVVRNLVLGKRSLDGNSSLKSHRGISLELVRDSDYGSIHGCGEVAVQENRERERMAAFSKGGGLSEELPALELSVLALAVCAVALVRSLLENVKLERSSKASDLNNLVLNIQEHLSSDEGTSALLSVAVENHWRALDAPVNGNI